MWSWFEARSGVSWPIALVAFTVLVVTPAPSNIGHGLWVPYLMRLPFGWASAHHWSGIVPGEAKVRARRGESPDTLVWYSIQIMSRNRRFELVDRAGEFRVPDSAPLCDAFEVFVEGSRASDDRDAVPDVWLGDRSQEIETRVAARGAEPARPPVLGVRQASASKQESFWRTVASNCEGLDAAAAVSYAGASYVGPPMLVANDLRCGDARQAARRWEAELREEEHLLEVERRRREPCLTALTSIQTPAGDVHLRLVDMFGRSWGEATVESPKRPELMGLAMLPVTALVDLVIIGVQWLMLALPAGAIRRAMGLQSQGTER